MNATTEQLHRGGRSRLAPVLIAVLFLLPMVGAWVAFSYFPEQMRTLGTTNFGEFIQPPQAVPVAGLERLAGPASTDGLFKDKWTYLYVGGSACDDRCQAQLYETRQVRLTQGKEIHRLQRVFVVTDDTGLDELLPFVGDEHPQLTVLRAGAEVQAQLRSALRTDERDPLVAQRVYVIDPLGRAIMYYDPAATPDEVLENAEGMRADMAKLLHNSKGR